jgi:AcrR family transcriptional regulator
MSPRLADPGVRTALLDTAARLIAVDGSAGLTLRRLVEEVGTSTMAVYTHFGGMQNLRQEIRLEGFARLKAHLEAVPPGSDPLSDIALLGRAYYDNAIENPHMYRVMFLETHEPAEDLIGLDTFQILVDCVARCVEAGRLDAAEPFDLAVQLWATAHGLVSLQLAGLLSAELAAEMLVAGQWSLLLAFGADSRALTRALGRANRNRGAPPRASRRELGSATPRV